MQRFWPTDRAVERIARCIFGLFLFGTGVAMLIEADLGAAPWDVFHVGINEITGISVGTIIIATGVGLLLLWIPLREQPGLGTILNAVQIGLVVDLVSPHLPQFESVPVRVIEVLIAVVLIAIGSGFYIGAGLGPGPRDGLMTGLSKRGISVRLARTVVEVTVLVVGLILGGTAGFGTVAFVVGIGPLVQIFLPRLTMPAPAAPLLATPGHT